MHFLGFCSWFQLVFPRDWTSRGTSHCPFVPGQKNFLVPVSLYPGTRAGANVPGQTPLSRDFTFPNEHKRQEKDVLKQEKDVLKQKIWSFYLKIFNSFCPRTFAPALVPGKRDTGTRKNICPGTKGQRDVLRDVPSRRTPSV